MNPSKNCFAIIKEFEGLKLEAYQCPAGVWTIGYGHTKGVYPGMKITKTQAAEFLIEDTKDSVEAINRLVKVELSQNQFDALVSFIYNVGQGNFEKSTLRRQLNRGMFESAADEFPKWRKGGGKVLPGLVKRRSMERELFLSPINT